MGGQGGQTAPPDTKNREGEQKSGRGKRGKGKKKEGKEEKREGRRERKRKGKGKGKGEEKEKKERKGKEKRRKGKRKEKGGKRGKEREEKRKKKLNGLTFCAYVRTPKFIGDIEGVPVCKLPPTFTETFRPRPKLKNIADLYETLINIMFHRYLNISNGMNFA